MELTEPSKFGDGVRYFGGVPTDSSQMGRRAIWDRETEGVRSTPVRRILAYALF